MMDSLRVAKADFAGLPSGLIPDTVLRYVSASLGGLGVCEMVTAVVIELSLQTIRRDSRRNGAAIAARNRT